MTKRVGNCVCAESLCNRSPAILARYYDCPRENNWTHVGMRTRRAQPTCVGPILMQPLLFNSQITTQHHNFGQYAGNQFDVPLSLLLERLAFLRFGILPLLHVNTAQYLITDIDFFLWVSPRVPHGAPSRGYVIPVLRDK